MFLRPPHPISETRLEFGSTKRTKPKDSKKQPNNVVQNGNSRTCKYLTKHVICVIMGLHFEVFEVNSPIMRAHNSDHGEATMQNQTTNAKTTDTMQCLIDGHHGVYVPQVFATAFQMADWGITEEQAEILRHGPDHANADDRDDPQEVYAEQCWGELYWDVWDEVLNNAEWRDGEGNLWHLHQDSDLFAVRADHDHDHDNI